MADNISKVLLELSMEHKIIAFQELSISLNMPIEETEKTINELEKQGRIKVLHRSSGCPIAFEML